MQGRIRVGPKDEAAQYAIQDFRQIVVKAVSVSDGLVAEQPVAQYPQGQRRQGDERVGGDALGPSRHGWAGLRGQQQGGGGHQGDA